MQTDPIILRRIGRYCRAYRQDQLQMTLQQIAGGQYKALSAFEHGRSSNLLHIVKYLRKILTHYDRLIFLEELLFIIEGVELYDY